VLIRPVDLESLRECVRCAQPFPHFMIDEFLDPDFAEQVHVALPSHEDAVKVGHGFSAVNEKGKVQVTDSSLFPSAVTQLHDALADPRWLETLSYVMDIPELLADPKLTGGGIHMTGPRGHLDVHVDFNYIPDRKLHRRLNILVYLNKGWQPQWGGATELWDQTVSRCHHTFLPIFNRCVVFETSDISYHGVTAVTCPPGVTRKSFAAYYYTTQAPDHWTGQSHDTIFRARPDERFKGRVLMPVERAWRGIQGLRNRLRGR